MSILTFLVLIWLHFVGDFLFQTDRIALNKSKENSILVYHVVLYAIPFLIFGVYFAVVTAFLHFLVDFVTSRLTSYLWKQEQIHWFFVVIGLDQALHLTFLILTFLFLTN